MKPPVFDYYDPRTLDQALDLLAEHGTDAKVLAGGQSLMPLLNMRLARPGVVVDLNRIAALAYVEVADDTLVVGAMTRQADAEASAEVGRHLPLLIETLRQVGHPPIRNRGTVGGSIAHADPAAELPALLLCLDGEVVAARRGARRTIRARDLFRTYLTTALDPEEILVEVRFPLPPAGTGGAFEELARRHGDYALVGVAATVRIDDGRIVAARLAFAGCGPVPVTPTGIEGLLVGARPTEELWEVAARAAAEALQPDDDVHASGAYRRRAAAVLAARALRRAAQRAGGDL
ncbi:MAG: FAD binding domain-containing protein [Armatimonadota bacterium]|nr:FAD binding domain-containing protein [Armatimonadota bacterium]